MNKIEVGQIRIWNEEHLREAILFMFMVVSINKITVTIKSLESTDIFFRTSLLDVEMNSREATPVMIELHKVD